MTTNICFITEDVDMSQFSLGGDLSGSQAINIASDHFSIGYFHLYEAMALIADDLQGADLAYYSEFKWLINARRYSA